MTKLVRRRLAGKVFNFQSVYLLHRHASAMDMGAVKAPMIRRSKACKRSRQSVSISQSRFFRSTAWTRRGKVVIRRQLKRRYVLAFFQKLPSCLVGIEACASSHHWSRELQALGHTVKPDQWSDSRRIAAAMAGCGSGIGGRAS
jgi:hypothetical protein